MSYTALKVGALQLALTGVYVDGAGNKIADCPEELPSTLVPIWAGFQLFAKSTRKKMGHFTMELVQTGNGINECIN